MIKLILLSALAYSTAIEHELSQHVREAVQDIETGLLPQYHHSLSIDQVAASSAAKSSHRTQLMIPMLRSAPPNPKAEKNSIEQSLQVFKTPSRMRKSPTLIVLHEERPLVARSNRALGEPTTHQSPANVVDQAEVGSMPESNLINHQSESPTNDLVSTIKQWFTFLAGTPQRKTPGLPDIEQGLSQTRTINVIEHIDIPSDPLKPQKAVYGHLFTPAKPRHDPPKAFTNLYYKDLQRSSKLWAKAFLSSDANVQDAFKYVLAHQTKNYFDKKFEIRHLSFLDFQEAYEEFIRFTTLERALEGKGVDVRDEAEIWMEKFHEFFNRKEKKSMQWWPFNWLANPFA